MNPGALFAVGILVTLIWGGGISLLVYAAILDGREAERRKAHRSEPQPPSARKPQVVADDTGADDDVPAAA
jgi:hypothetical protein